ncbi:marvel domain-containing protein [Xylariomycetidae sp. FL2044]|nr:marvel domain-containing protein [Xylariomycetidae sp. FL2044]
MLSLLGLVLRSFLFLVGALVLGVSIDLAKHQKYGTVPAETSYCVFAGGFGMVASAVGFLALWVEGVKGIVTKVLDSVSFALYLSGSIALTVAMKGIASCTSDYSFGDRYENKIINGGCTEHQGQKLCAVADIKLVDQTPGRCQRAQADFSIQYIGCFFVLVMLILGHILARLGGPTHYRPRVTV